MTGKPEPAKLNGVIEDKDAYVHTAYEGAVGYYRKAARSTRRNYKTYRFLTIFLGALVTLISSLAATSYVQDQPWAKVTFALATPIIAATLTVITGLSQSFQWGSTWRDMTVHAQKIAGERDRFLATEPGKRNYVKELDTLNTLMLIETESFFHRILDAQAGVPEAMEQREEQDTEPEPELEVLTEEVPASPATGGVG